MKKLIIALGGNALIQKGQRGTAEEQFENIRKPIAAIAELSRTHHVVITHGNGPQSGNLLLQQEATDEVPKMPLSVIGAQTQGQIGFMIESTLDEELMRLGLDDERLFLTIGRSAADGKDEIPSTAFFTSIRVSSILYSPVELFLPNTIPLPGQFWNFMGPYKTKPFSQV